MKLQVAIFTALLTLIIILIMLDVMTVNELRNLVWMIPIEGEILLI